MLARYVWKERQSDDSDDIRRIETTCKRDSDLCVDQYDLLRSNLSIKNVTSLESAVSHI